MHSFRTASLAILLLLALMPIASAQSVDVTNNQPFPIDMPWLIRGLKTPADKQAQQAGDDTIVMVNVPASGKANALDAKPYDSVVTTIAPTDTGVSISYGKADLGKLSWSLVYAKLNKTPNDEEAAQTDQYFEKEPAALPLAFKKTASGPLFDTWSASAKQDGLALAVSLDVYKSGFIDIHQTITNESAPKGKAYAAVACRWDQPKSASRSIGYDNHILPLEENGKSPFRKGEGRYLFMQRGLDWVNNTFDGASVVLMNDFTSSFTFHRDAKDKPKLPPRWVGANLAQLGTEVIAKGQTLWNITEIARPNIKYYVARYEANILPPANEPITSTSRLIIAGEKKSDERADQCFIAYTSFNPQKKTADNSAQLSFGVPYTRFGTAYFPYSTLGENFEAWHMPGQSQDTYWPLSADTVTNYKLFADDIKRDLRIAKAMGFESIRLHHLELIATLPKDIQNEYLDFLFSEIKHLGLTALLDVKLQPQRVAELVKKYRPQVDGVEIDNEVLIFGINDPDVPIWKDIYKAVKEVAPDMPVWLTCQTNTGAFDRIKQMGVTVDKVGSHAYMDSIDSIPSSRDFSLAVADYAAKNGQEPIITEWNWRFLTRMTPEARAEVYPPIFENVLKVRSMPVVYQFQFQESLAMASKTLRGIRHYEQLNLSRRPRPEAFEFVKLIQKYGNPASPQNALKTEYQSVTMQDVMKGAAQIKVSAINQTDKPISVTATAEGPASLKLSIVGDGKFDIQPKQTATADLNVVFPQNAPPGFYHTFVRFEGADGFISYAWVEIRNPGPATLDKEKGVHAEVKYDNGALDYDLNRDIAIVYPNGRDSESRWDLESAWLIYQTLESATGRPVKIFQEKDLPADLKKSGNLIFVKMPNWNGSTQPTKGAKSWVTREHASGEHGDWLIVNGNDEASLNLSAIDFTLRYWKNAKDAGMRKIPLTDKPIEKGSDPTFLP